MRKLKLKRQPTTNTNTTVCIRPGWMVADCSTASGGVTYDREKLGEKQINQRVGLQTEHKTMKTVDHVQVCAAIDAVVKRVDYILRKHCARTPIGWFADQPALLKVKAEVEEIKAEATDLNRQAERSGSERRAYIQIVPLRLDLAHAEATQEIARTVRTVLTEIRDVLRSGKLADLHKLRIRSINLDKLATGFQSDAIRFALDRVPIAAKEIREALKRGERKAAIGAKLDLESIEAALAHFENSPLSQGEFDPVGRALGKV